MEGFCEITLIILWVIAYIGNVIKCGQEKQSDIAVLGVVFYTICCIIDVLLQIGAGTFK